MFESLALMLRISLQRFAQHDNYLNPIHGGTASNFQNQSRTINNQQTKREVRGVLKL